MQATLQTAVTLLKDKQTVAARPLLEQLLARHPEDAETRFWMGVCDQFDGELASAEERFQGLATDAPDFDKALYALGLVREERGNLPGAIDAWQTAYSTNPNNRSAIRKLEEHGAFSPQPPKTQAERRRLYQRSQPADPRPTPTKPSPPQAPARAAPAPRKVGLTIGLDPMHFKVRGSRRVTVSAEEPLARLLFMAVQQLLPPYYYSGRFKTPLDVTKNARFVSSRTFQALPREGTVRDAKIRDGDELVIQIALFPLR